MLLLSTHSLNFPVVVHPPAFPSTWPVIPSLRRGLSINPGATTWYVYGCSRIDEVWFVLQRGNSSDGCQLVSTLCKYDSREDDLFVPSWARARQVRSGGVSSELLSDGGVRRILLLALVARCLETIDVCIWHMFVFMSVVVTVWGSMGMFVVYWPLLKIVF